MKKSFILLVLFTILPIVAVAQNKELTPEEMAEKETKALSEYLELSESQEFYVDSILVSNYSGSIAAYEELRRSGRQDREIYVQTGEKWQNSTLEAMKKVLTEQQYIKYLKRIGKGKEYKKGKDGVYYLKEDLKNQKVSDKNSQ